MNKIQVASLAIKNYTIYSPNILRIAKLKVTTFSWQSLNPVLFHRNLFFLFV